MRTTEILRELPGATRDWLYYLESRRYVHPRKVKAGKLRRHRYSGDDVEKIRLMWGYCQEGFPPKVAHEKARADLTYRATEASVGAG